MERLIDGVRTYQRREFPTMRLHMRRLVERQKPRALFITCSDSRIEPSRLTSSHPGELFVIRNAGNVVPSSHDANGVVATIEYAVKALGVPEIVVCGHSHCGAMNALMCPDDTKQLPSFGTWLDQELRDLVDRADGSNSLWDIAIANVQLQLQRLRSIPMIRKAEAAGDLEVNGWCYRFETGEVVEVVDRDNPDASTEAVTQP